MRLNRLLGFLSFVLLLANCAGTSRFPTPTHSKYISGIGGGVEMESNHGVKKPFKMSTRCRLSPSAPAAFYIVGQFPSPAPGIHLANSKPQRVSPGSEFDVVSESFGRIKNNQNYPIRIKAYQDKACTQLMDEVTQSVRFEMPPLIMNKFIGIADKVL